VGRMVCFERIDPELRARDYRKRMIQSRGDRRRFLVARISGTEQERDTPIFRDCFRVRDYIKPRDKSKWMQRWLDASTDEVLSPSFVGLDERGVKKLEFQNPPYVAASRLGGDPRHYNSVFTLQACGCSYECSFCFVPRELNNPLLEHGSYFSVSEILDCFVDAKRVYDERGVTVKVIRLSGGEVTTLIPELVVDVNNEINRRCMSRSTYLWVDTNLSIDKYLTDVEDELKVVARQRNVGFVGCLKAVGDKETGKDDFSIITKALPKFFAVQFRVLDYLVNNIGADVYVYILPIASPDRILMRKRLEELFQALRTVHRNLPLRANMLEIHRYAPTETNLKEADEQGRPLPVYDEPSAFATWYDILKQQYPPDDLRKYRCQVPLD